MSGASLEQRECSGTIGRGTPGRPDDPLRTSSLATWQNEMIANARSPAFHPRRVRRARFACTSRTARATCLRSQSRPLATRKPGPYASHTAGRRNATARHRFVRSASRTLSGVIVPSTSRIIASGRNCRRVWKSRAANGTSDVLRSSRRTASRLGAKPSYLRFQNSLPMRPSDHLGSKRSNTSRRAG